MEKKIEMAYQKDDDKIAKLVELVFQKAKKECLTHSQSALCEQIEDVITNDLNGKITKGTLIRYDNKYISGGNDKSPPNAEKQNLLKLYLKTRYKDTKYEELEEELFGSLKSNKTPKQNISLEVKNKSTEILGIPGADIINQAFIEKIENDIEFSATQFYSAKQDTDCQWYGIIKKYDIDRDIYSDLKNTVLSDFKKRRTNKLCAIIQGDGGTGKSTLLRRLAIDCSKENFITLWIKDTEFGEFCENGLGIIKEQKDVNFLILIEDWYRIWETNQFRLIANSLFNKVSSIPNTRLVIGNRDQGMNLLKKNLNNNSSLFKLENKENQEILQKIASKNIKWKEIIDDYFVKEEHYKSSLFILLFIITNYLDEKFKDIDLCLDEPEIMFRFIIRYDFKDLAQRFPVFISLIIYIAKIYEKEKYVLSYDFLLELTNLLNSTTEISQHFSNFKLSTVFHYSLRKYLHTDEITLGKYIKKKVLRFNHDLLAEKGISHLDKDFKKITIDDFFKKNILKKLLGIKRYDKDVSIFIRYYLDHEETIFDSLTDRVNIISTLINNGNRDVHYLKTITKYSLVSVDFHSIIQSLFERNIFLPPQIWKKYLKENPDQAISKIINHAKFLDFPLDLISNVMSKVKDEHLKDRAYEKIIKHKQLLRFPDYLIAETINNIKDKQLQETTCKKFINHEYFTSFADEVISSVINNIKNKGLKKIVLCPSLKLHYENNIFYVS